MANVQARRGFRWANPSNDPSAQEYAIAPSSYGTDLFIGDAVVQASGGGVTVGSISAQSINKCAEGGAIYGVITGFKTALDGNGSMDLTTQYGKGSTDRICLVRRVQKGDRFIIQDDGTLASGARSALGVSNIGLNANINVGTAGNTTYGTSGMELKGSTAATSATLQVKILGVSTVGPNNDPTTAYCDWIVEFNNCASAGGTGTAGV